MSDFSLGNEFSKPTHDHWLDLVAKTLKGADFDETLISHTYDGLTIEPLYHEGEHRPQDIGLPGQAPFRRGMDQTTIHLCQSFAHPDIEQTNREILDDLAGGVTAIRLKIDDGVSGGIAVNDLSDMERVLADVFLDMISIEVDAGVRGPEIAGLLSTLWQDKKITAKARGSFLLDPIGLMARRNQGEASLESAVHIAQKTSARTPGVATLCVDMRAGASEAQEIAIAAATGVAYLRAMEHAGMGLEIAARQICFLLNVDTDVFLNIAKVRAFRQIWSQITAASGIDAQCATIKLETARHMMAANDPWVNMLRVTAACFAATVAGASSITIAPYTEALGLPDGFGRRIARNTHIILKEEAHLANVEDPAGGSWFIENMTDQLIDKAWGLFQEIEAEGGIVAALKSNMVRSKIAAVEALRQNNIETGKDVLVGVNRFVNTDEKPVPVLDPTALSTGGKNE
jgi:methylmalonyl-CoA mutase